MQPSFSIGTLKLTLPIGRTLLAGIAILAGAVGLLEAAARGGFVLPYWLTPEISGHENIGRWNELLANVERQEGPVDCFIIGSSTVFRGIDPQVISRAIADDTGQPIRCFEFSVPGLTFPGAARLAGILAAKYHPRLIMYAMNYRDAGIGFTMDIPWADQQLGKPSLEGWLETNSAAYRYYLGFRKNIRSPQPLLPIDQRLAYGFLPSDVVADVSEPPLDGTNFNWWWRDFQIANRQKFVTWLRAFLALKSSETSLIVIEMPVPPSMLRISPEGEQAYHRFAGQIGEEAGREGVPFVQAPPDDVIPADGWQDYVHLNRTGAAAFSAWLGKQIGQMARAGLISGPSP